MKISEMAIDEIEYTQLASTVLAVPSNMDIKRKKKSPLQSQSISSTPASKSTFHMRIEEKMPIPNMKARTQIIDPKRDQVVTVLRNSGLTYQQISTKCGIATTTMRNWEKGKTRNPLGITMEFALNAVGFEMVIRKRR